MFRAAILDLDGTIYRGSKLIPGADEAISRLVSGGVQVRYLTNNSSIPREQIAEKLLGFGLPATPEQCYGTAWGAAQYCVVHGITSAFVVGEAGLSRTLVEHGISVDASEPESVIVGICRHFSYDLLNEAMQHLRRGATLIATNTDATYPMEAGREVPGAGAMVASAETVCGRKAIPIGKPEPVMVEMILRELHLNPDEAVMVGDRPDTDMEAARRAGCRAHLVLTGVTSAPLDGFECSESLLDWVLGLGL